MSAVIVDHPAAWATVAVDGLEVTLAVGSEYDANEYMIHLTPEECITLSRALVKAAAEALGVGG